MHERQMIQSALSFIEKNLHHELTPEAVSAQVFYSLPHLYRVFRSTLGSSIKAYIARRRLSLAAESLLCSRKKVLDIALDLGYSSPETFLRAFKKVYGTTPLDFRKQALMANLYPVPSLEKFDTLKQTLTPTLAYHTAVPIHGRTLRTSLNDQRNLRDLPRFWQKLTSDGWLDSLIPTEPFYGVYTDWQGENDFSFIAGRRSAGTGRFTIPASRYAVFTMTPFDPALVTQFWDRIYGEWFLLTNLERTDRLVDFERYTEGFQTYEVFIPLKG